MREIKFRAWDKHCKRMVYTDHGDISRTGENEWEWSPFQCVFDDYEELPKFEDIIWMQFTGLSDKNGKEIYEGDILKNHHYEPHVVEWQSGECCNFIATGWFWDEECTKKAEVIGNIYEHENLLKKD